MQSCDLDPQLLHLTIMYQTSLFQQVPCKDEKVFQGRRLCSCSNYKRVLALNPLTLQGGMWPLLALVAWHEFGFEAYFNSHRIIESFGLEGTPRGHLVQPPKLSEGCICVHWSLIVSAKRANKEGANVRWITRTEVYNRYSEDNTSQICTEYQLIA